MPKSLSDFKTQTEVVEDPKNYVECVAEALLQIAEKHGYVVTIEQQPLTPLAMGNYKSVVNVREKRKP